MKRSSFAASSSTNVVTGVAEFLDKKKKLSEENEESDSSKTLSLEFPLLSSTDVETALRYVRNVLISNSKSGRNVSSPPYPPIVFVHQLYDVIKSKTDVHRQIEVLRNLKKIVVIHLGNERNMKVAVFLDDLKGHVLQKCDLSEKFVYRKFFDVLTATIDIGISRINLISKYRFSENDIRFMVNTGLLILRDTGVLWFSFPSAGIFMKKLIKGRRLLLTTMKKRKYREVLESELKKLPVCKSLELPIMYHIHDLVGGGFVDCVQTSSGRLLQIVNS